MAPAPTLYGKRDSPRITMEPDGDSLGGVPALEFINTTDRHGDPAATDRFASGYVNLLDWSVQTGTIDADTARRLALLAGKAPREAAEVRRRAISLRTALHEIVSALVAGASPSPEALATLNLEAGHARSRQVLVAADDRLDWGYGGRPDLDHPLHLVALSAADLFVSGHVDRIRSCDAPGCERVFLDTSKNRSRRYCSTSSCGSRVRVRRFRERQRTGDG
jgi:predicted RNA-binding Zn ribbon-like protein